MFTASMDLRQQSFADGNLLFATEWKVVGRQERVRAGGREGEGDAPCPPPRIILAPPRSLETTRGCDPSHVQSSSLP